MNIFDSILSQATPIINYLIDCDNLNVAITYKKYSGQIFNSIIGANVDNYLETSLEGIETFHTKKSVLASQRGMGQAHSNIEVGDRVFIFFEGAGVLPNGVSLKDQIKMSDETTYNVKSILPIRGFCTIITVDS